MSRSRWLSTTSRVRSNHQADTALRAAPLSGMGVVSTLSKAERRSLTAISRVESSTRKDSRTLP